VISAKLKAKPQPHDFGVTMRRSFGFHQRDLTRATVGRRQSKGTPRYLPVAFLLMYRA